MFKLALGSKYTFNSNSNMETGEGFKDIVNGVDMSECPYLGIL